MLAASLQRLLGKKLGPEAPQLTASLAFIPHTHHHPSVSTSPVFLKPSILIQSIIFYLHISILHSFFLHMVRLSIYLHIHLSQVVSSIHLSIIQSFPLHPSLYIYLSPPHQITPPPSINVEERPFIPFFVFVFYHFLSRLQSLVLHL